MTRARIVRLGRKGQIVLPKEIREALGLKEGDSLIVALEEGQAVLLTPERYAALTKGILEGTWGRTREEIEQYLEEDRESWARKED